MDLTLYACALYAIYDVLAQTLMGGIYLHKHEAGAVRFFCDVASDPQTLIAKHPQDFDLIRLGYITHHTELVADHAIILKGSTWAATNLKLEG